MTGKIFTLFVHCIKTGLLCASSQIFAGSEQIPILVNGNLEDWREQQFVGHTSYQRQAAQDSNTFFLAASSHNAASGYFLEKTIDLEKTPILHWSWRVHTIAPVADEKTQSGDDFPIRIYVIMKGGWQFWKIRTLNYLWAHRADINHHWHNPFTSNSRMLAVRSGHDKKGKWLWESRNVRTDLKRVFGEEIRYIHGIALMSDTDNTGGHSRADVGDIYFATE